MKTWLTATQWNLLANFVGQSSNAVLTFVFIPQYLHYLGIEAYGVVGFSLALQTALTVFDLGLSTTANRELAQLSTRPTAANEMRAVVRALQRFSWLIAGILGCFLFFLAPVLAHHWLQPQNLSVEEVADALHLMAIAVCLQWPTVFYTGCLSGLQQQRILNLINLLAALLRFPGIVLLLAYGSANLRTFFLGQIAVSAMHTFAVAWTVWRLLPAADPAAPAEPIAWQRLRQFAAEISGISATTLILTQFDKLLLSRYLPLQQFSYYSLASTFVSGLGIVSMPVYVAMFPRFSQLVDTAAKEELRTLYHHSAQLLAALLLPIGVVLLLFPETVLLVWTNDTEISHRTGTILRLLALGTTCNCLLLIPHALQLAHGWTRLALCMNTSLGVTIVPLILVLAPWAGGEGTALAWVLVNVLYLMIGVPLMHRRLLLGDLWYWVGADVLLPLAPVLAVNTLLWLLVVPSDRVEGALLLGAAVLAGFAGSLLTVPVTRAWLWRALSSVCIVDITLRVMTHHAERDVYDGAWGRYPLLS